MHNLIKVFGLDKLSVGESLSDTARLDDLPVAIYATDKDGHIIYYNRAAISMWGQVPVKGRDKWCCDYDLYTMDGRYIPRENCAMALAAKEGKALRGIEAIARRPDGTAFRFLPFPTPLHNDAGEIVGAVNMVIYLGEHALDLPHAEIDFLHAL